MLTWTEVLARSSDKTVAKITRLFASFENGDLTREQLVTSLVALLVVSGHQAVALADEYTAVQLGEQTGMEGLVVPQGLELEDMGVEEDLYDVTDEALDTPDALTALAVIGRAYVLGRAQIGRHEALKAQGIQWWTRDPEPGACEVCEDLSSGIVSIDEVMWTHKGCGCAQEPVLPTNN